MPASRVITPVANAILRIRWNALSATKRSSAVSMKSPRGSFIRAEVAGPPSPKGPVLPIPA